MSGVWVWIENNEGQAASASWEALGLGRRFADGTGGELSALVFGTDAATIAQEAIQRGADKASGASAGGAGMVSCWEGLLQAVYKPEQASMGVGDRLWCARRAAGEEDDRDTAWFKREDVCPQCSSRCCRWHIASEVE